MSLLLDNNMLTFRYRSSHGCVKSLQDLKVEATKELQPLGAVGQEALSAKVDGRESETSK